MMKKRIIIFCSLILLFLFLANNEVRGAVGDPCNCYFDAWDLINPCIDLTPPGCDSGETCSCIPEVEVSTGVPISCYPGTCVLEATPIPTPTGVQHGTCDPYMTVTGCTAVNTDCESGYRPVVSADCSFCWCELAPAQGGCSDRGGDCRSILHNRCPAGYQSTPDGNAGDWDCSSTQHCCIRLTSDCHSWNLITGCQDGYSRCDEDPLVCCQEISDCPAPPPPPPPPGAAVIDTAIGPIDVSSPEAFVNKILTLALGIGGGIAVLLIIIGGTQVLTSAGNPERAKAGQELITSAVSGLLLIIFAVFLLKLIGKDILKIPDFEP